MLITSTLYCENTADVSTDILTTQEEIANFNFNYENEDIINIINQLAALKDLNVILPQGDILNAKVTLHIEKKITLTQA